MTSVSFFSTVSTKRMSPRRTYAEQKRAVIAIFTPIDTLLSWHVIGLVLEFAGIADFGRKSVTFTVFVPSLVPRPRLILDRRRS